MNDQQLTQHIEGILFALGKPLSRADLMKVLGVDQESLERAAASLHSNTGRGVVLVDDGKMFELRTAPEVGELIERMRKEEGSRDIGRAGLEVLSTILYRGPLTRAEVDFIRGVNSSQTMRTLTMRGLIRKVPNPKDERSFLYEATTELFAAVGSTSPHDLLEYDAVRAKLTGLEEMYRSTSVES
jgi:segregation and condensation protein B